MIWIYVAAAIFGGGFVLPALLGSLDLDTDADFDMDIDVDMDLDVDTADVEAGGATAIAAAAGGIGDWVASLLSFRTLTFFSMFFGAVGIVLTRMDYSEPLPLLAAVALGGFAGVLNARLMAYLKRSDSSAQVNERHLAGSIARVVLPIGHERRGRVEVDVAGQPTFMVALPYTSHAPDLARGDQVVVVEVKGGTAYVTPAPELRGGK